MLFLLGCLKVAYWDRSSTDRKNQQSRLRLLHTYKTVLLTSTISILIIFQKNTKKPHQILKRNTQIVWSCSHKLLISIFLLKNLYHFYWFFRRQFSYLICLSLKLFLTCIIFSLFVFHTFHNVYSCTSTMSTRAFSLVFF